MSCVVVAVLLPQSYEGQSLISEQKLQKQNWFLYNIFINKGIQNKNVHQISPASLRGTT